MASHCHSLRVPEQLRRSFVGFKLTAIRASSLLRFTVSVAYSICHVPIFVLSDFLCRIRERSWDGCCLLPGKTSPPAYASTVKDLGSHLFGFAKWTRIRVCTNALVSRDPLGDNEERGGPVGMDGTSETSYIPGVDEVSSEDSYGGFEWGFGVFEVDCELGWIRESRPEVGDCHVAQVVRAIRECAKHDLHDFQRTFQRS
ncbi:hypothetical protein BC830DRAFT_1106355 [Chytriomyces sp. MP71]|nr:hypothetical protein BC830DRAFT_1106355 [Chytriomyces sp. MP71]